jgi:hypothetical protein
VKTVRINYSDNDNSDDDRDVMMGGMTSITLLASSVNRTIGMSNEDATSSGDQELDGVRR